MRPPTGPRSAATYTKVVQPNDAGSPPDPILEAPHAARVRWLGHATAEIEVDGARLLTDPMLVNEMAPLVRRRAIEPAWIEAERHVDAVLISHAHQDHLHLPSLRLLSPDTLILVPQGMGRWLEQRGFEHVEEMTAGRETWVGAVRVRATHAAHEGRRLPFGPAAPALGYLVEGSSACYFAGDTDIFDEMAELPGVLDTPLSAALLPVGGWGPTLGAGHMNPQRAAAALRLLAPTHAVPIHWGTYWPRGLERIRPDRFHEPGPTFGIEAAAAAPSVQVHVIRPGETVDLSAAERD